jgi:hypothetical protein
MAKRCDLPLYKGIMPKVKITDLTETQVKRLAAMDDTKKKFFMNDRLYADESEKDLMEGMAYIFGRRLEAKTNKGINMQNFTNETYEKALKAAQEAGYNSPEAIELGDEILKRVPKGSAMTNQERALALPAFLNRFESLPLLNKQFLAAVDSGDDNLIATFGAEIAKSMAIFAGVRADQNALSVGLNTYKYMYKQIQSNAKITKLFENGAC